MKASPGKGGMTVGSNVYIILLWLFVFVQFFKRFKVLHWFNCYCKADSSWKQHRKECTFKLQTKSFSPKAANWTWQGHPVAYLNNQLGDIWRAAAATEASPVAGPACPPLSALARCRGSAASAPAHELLGGGADQSETSREETENQFIFCFQ